MEVCPGNLLKSGSVSTTSDKSLSPPWTDPLNRKVVFRVRDREVLNWIRILEKSVDGGTTWIKSKDIFSDPLVMAFDLANDHVIYLSEKDTLYKTYDAGVSWRKMYNFPTDFISAVLPSPANPESVFVGTQGLFLSENGGSKWQNLNNGIGMGRVELMIGSDDSTLFAVEKTPSWNSMKIQRLFHSLNGGHDWELLIDQPGNALSFGANNTIYYSVSPSNDAFGSSDNGKTWFMYKKPRFNDGQPTSSILANPRNPKVMYSLYLSNVKKWNDRIRVSFNTGQTWQETLGIDSDVDNISRLFFGGDQGQVVYAVISDNTVLRSSDSGKSWETCLNNVTIGRSESMVAVDPQDENVLYVGAQSGYLHVSYDGCKSWITENISVDVRAVNSVAIDPNRSSTVYVGTYGGGAYVSYDKGKHWGAINDGLIGTTIMYSIAVNSHSNVYATTPNGIFQLYPK